MGDVGQFLASAVEKHQLWFTDLVMISIFAGPWLLKSMLVNGKRTSDIHTVAGFLLRFLDKKLETPAVNKGKHTTEIRSNSCKTQKSTNAWKSKKSYQH